MKDTRRLAELGSVGPATLRDFERLGIRSVGQLARRNPERLYERLCEITGQAQDICCLDVFRSAVAQARNPHLPAAQRRWWYWSRRRAIRPQSRPPRLRLRFSSKGRKPPIRESSNDRPARTGPFRSHRFRE